jgi:hypothetical protein
MRAFLLALGCVLTMGCLGEASATPEELKRYDFIAEVKVNPTTPVAGRMVNLNVELVSHSSDLVVVDVVLRAIRTDGTQLHEQIWRDVTFHPEEVWNLTQGFISRNDEKGAFTVVIETRAAGTDKVLWFGGGPSLTFR